MFKKSKKIVGQQSTERLSHFVCGQCRKYWAIGDAPSTRRKWFCPWCGAKQEMIELKKQ